jgi:hypothetical protein
VDGHSVDDTIAVARQLRPDVRVVQQTRRGKGNALACGFEAATGDVIAMVDADGSTDPGEIPKFVNALLSGADFAKGTRFAAGGGSSDITQLRRLGNRMLGGVVNLCHGTHYSDLCYGFNVFWQKYVPALDLDITSPPSRRGDGRLWGDGFEIETLIHMRVAAEGLRVAEVPSFEHPRILGVSYLDAFSDGLRVLTTILVERRRARLRYRSRRRAWGARTAVVLARDLIHMETALVRMLYVLHSIEHGRPCRYIARSPIIGHGPHRRPQFPLAGVIVGHWISRPPPRLPGRPRPIRTGRSTHLFSGARRSGSSRTAVVVRADDRVSTAVGVREAPSHWPHM